MSASQEAAALVVAGAATEAVQKGLIKDEDAREDAAEYVAQAAGQATPSGTQEAPVEPQTPGEQIVADAQAELERDQNIVPEESIFAHLRGDLPDEDDDPEDDDLDLDAQDDDEPATAEPEDDPDEEPEDEWEPPEVKQLRRQLAKAQREAEKQKQLRVQSSAKDWKKEVARRFPLADVDSIQADSKRAFLRAAQKSHAAAYKLLKPHLDAAEQAIKEKVRADAEAAWGKPVVGPTTVPIEAAADSKELEEARKTGDLVKIVGALRRLGGKQ